MKQFLKINYLKSKLLVELLPHFKLFKVQNFVSIFVQLIKYALNVVKTDVISDSFEEEDDFIEVKSITVVSVNLVEQVEKILLQRGGVISPQQLFLCLN